MLKFYKTCNFFNFIIKCAIEDIAALKYKEKQEKEFLNIQNLKQKQLNETNRTIHDQVSGKNNVRTLDKHIYGYEKSKVKERANEILSVEQQLKEDRKVKSYSHNWP